MKHSDRRRARECAVQALYSWQLSKNNISDVKYQFLNEHDIKNVDISYFCRLIFGVAINSKNLDVLMTPYLSRNLTTLSHIEKAVLRISLYEFSKCSDVPYKVIINEGIELAKVFGATDSYKFINGVLDKIGPQIRPNLK